MVAHVSVEFWGFWKQIWDSYIGSFRFIQRNMPNTVVFNAAFLPVMSNGTVFNA